MYINKKMLELNIDSYMEMMRRFEMLEENKVDSFVYNYVASLIENISIGIFDKPEEIVINLINNRRLEGYCWETTSMLVPFFGDSDYISRGNLYFSNEFQEYYHSWINFTFNDEDYVFDPCLNFLCSKTLYDGILGVETKGIITSLEVRDKLLDRLDSEDFIDILGTDEITDPFYRVNVRVRGKVRNNKINSLNVRY